MIARLAAALLIAHAAWAQAQVDLPHVHGLAYSPDGKRLMVPSHHGLAVYENGRWSRGPGPAHDYMGFAATARGLYSSGHPAPGSGLVNPFGLMRSRDGGRNWNKLGLEGEADFHLLAASWSGKAIYVWSEEPNSRIASTGLQATFDEGVTWKPAHAAGLRGKPIALAAHPREGSRVALATSQGVFLSRDGGASFVALADGQGTAVLFDLDGAHLWYGSFSGKPQLARASIDGKLVSNLPLPPLTSDAVAFIAQNPASRAQYAIATFLRSIYLSADAGRSWMQIADGGRTR